MLKKLKSSYIIKTKTKLIQQKFKYSSKWN